MSHDKNPPTLPTIVDEAADTPMWVPLVGLALVAAVAVIIGARMLPGLSPSTAAPAAEPAAKPE